MKPRNNLTNNKKEEHLERGLPANASKSYQEVSRRDEQVKTNTIIQQLVPNFDPSVNIRARPICVTPQLVSRKSHLTPQKLVYRM